MRVRQSLASGQVTEALYSKYKGLLHPLGRSHEPSSTSARELKLQAIGSVHP